MFTEREDQLFRENQGKGICEFCFEYSGYNALICGKKAKKVKCNVLDVVRKKKKRHAVPYSGCETLKIKLLTIKKGLKK